MCVGVREPVVRGKLEGVSFLPFPCGFLGSNLGHRACLQTHFPTEPTHWVKTGSFEDLLPLVGECDLRWPPGLAVK